MNNSSPTFQMKGCVSFLDFRENLLLDHVLLDIWDSLLLGSSSVLLLPEQKAEKQTIKNTGDLAVVHCQQRNNFVAQKREALPGFFG